jgi:hypothetical protein
MEDNPTMWETKWAEELGATMGQDAWDALVAISRKPGEERRKYITRVSDSELAKRVKIEDIRDNANPDRLDILDPPVRERLAKKYHTDLMQLRGYSVRDNEQG